MTASWLVDELARRSRAHMLAGKFYFDPEVYELDLERIWYHEWLFVAHSAEIPEVGDYLTLAIGTYPLIVIRDDDGDVRALHNVCRHRGSIVCPNEHGKARRLVCPYHQWSYHLDGSLAGARAVGDDFDFADHGLAHARCEVVAGMIFVSLATRPPDFTPLKELVEFYLAPFELDRARIAATSVTVEAGNWKLVVENNRECHHCRGAHPELTRSFPEEPLHTGGHSPADATALEDMVQRGESLGLPSSYAASPDNQFRLMRMPFKNDARSMTMTGEPAVARRFGQLPPDNLGDVLFYHYPTSWNHFMSDHAVTFRLLPLGPTATQLTTTWLVPEHAVEGVDYDLTTLTEVWMTTNAQDTALVERTQRGVQSPAFTPGPYAPIDELGVIEFVDWYADRMTSFTTAPQR